MEYFLGIDQSYSATGVAVITEKGELKHIDLIETDKKFMFKSLEIIKSTLTNIIRSYDGLIVRAALEGGSFNSTGAIFDLGALFGVVSNLLYEKGLDPIVVPPKLLKKFATGNANAKKIDIINSVKEFWKTNIENDNEADAFILAQIAKEVTLRTSQIRYQIEVVKTLTNMAIDKKSLKIRTKLPNV